MPTVRPITAALLWTGAALAAVAGALGLAAAVGPGPAVRHDRPFVLAEREGEPLRVSEAVPLVLPYDFGDCDVLATVELPAGGELDVVFRRVEPAGGHGRFTLLRLSASEEGPPFRTREQALFDDEMRGGVRLAPGLPASIRLELRGCTAHANVAGRPLPPAETVDAHGDLALVARGGEAAVRFLRIEPRPAGSRAWPVFAALFAAALVVGLELWRRRASPARGLIGLAVLPAAAFAAGRVLDAQLLADAAPDLECRVLLAAAALPLALALGLPGGGWRTLLRALAASLLALLAAEMACRFAAPRLLAFEDPRLDLYFGPESRQAPFGALARQLPGKNEVHAPHRDEARVVFLGGEPMFEANLDRTHHLAVQAMARAALAAGRKVRAAVVPTQFPNTLQQTLLYRRFYADAYAPLAVVLGIDRWDEQRESIASARAQLEALTPIPPPPPTLRLTALLPCRGPRVPIATPAELGRTLEEFAAFCAGRGTPLLLATHARLGADYRRVVEEIARARGLPLVHEAMSAEEHADAESLARALVPLLR